MFTTRVAPQTATVDQNPRARNKHVTRAEVTTLGLIKTRMPALVLDVSRTTMVMESDTPVPNKTPVEVRFPKIIVFGQVQYSHLSDGSYRTGIAITDIEGSPL